MTATMRLLSAGSIRRGVTAIMHMFERDVVQSARKTNGLATEVVPIFCRDLRIKLDE